MLQFFGGGDNLLCVCVCVCSCVGVFTDRSVVTVLVVAVCFRECQREWQALRAQLEQQIVDLRASLVSSPRLLVFSEGIGDSASVCVFCTTNLATLFLSGRGTGWQCGCGGDGGSDSSVTTSRCRTILSAVPWRAVSLCLTCCMPSVPQPATKLIVRNASSFD